jgi:hypothetical protein
MFNPVPPVDDPPPPAPREATELYVPDIALPGRRAPARMRIVKFALLGGGGTSILCGAVVGVLAWFVMPPEVVPFPSTDRFTFLSEGQRLVIWPLACTLYFAPFLFLVFAMAASAQAIASGFLQASSQRTRRLSEPASGQATAREERDSVEG